MNVSLFPKTLKGKLSVPTSKSLAHRAIICASLAQNTSVISNVSFSKDIEATIQSMRALGADIQVDGSTCTITGITQWQSCTCPCHESGSTLRFILPIAASQNIDCCFQGRPSLFSRPMDVYESIFKKQNLPFIQKEDSIQIHGSLQADEFIVPGNISSQFISGLLFCCPMLQKESIIRITPPFESRSYVDLTLDMLRQFQIIVHQIDDYTFSIPPCQVYQSHDCTIEGDYSQMAFFAVAGAIRNHIEIDNMRWDSLQGDRKILDWLAYEKQESSLLFQPQPLLAQTFDLADCPDLGPILCVLAAYSSGTSHLIHAERLRYKECDRIAAMEEELKKWGVAIESDEDSIIIHGRSHYSKDSMVIMDSHNDHRIAMACAIFAVCADSPSILENGEAVNKSYPNFFNDMDSL